MKCTLAVSHYGTSHPAHVLCLDRSIPDDILGTVDFEQRIITMGPILGQPVLWYTATNTKLFAYGLDVVQCR